VTSLRESTRAAALRRARTCYDHLAGRFGVALLESLVEHSALVRSDGQHGIERAPSDRLAAPVTTCPYTLGPNAEPVLARIGVPLAALVDRTRSARPLLRCCVDWSEQRHHLSGALGAAVLQQADTAGWVRRRPGGRAVEITAAGRTAFGDALGVQPVA
jgi:hypothetical protein